MESVDVAALDLRRQSIVYYFEKVGLNLPELDSIYLTNQPLYNDEAKTEEIIELYDIQKINYNSRTKGFDPYG